MTLDLGQLSPQIRALGRHLAGEAQQYLERLDAARALLAAASADELAAAALAEPGLARPVEAPAWRVAAPAAPPSFSVLAADGSQIEPDRHGAALWYLLNLGWAVIEYGAAPRAELASEPTLHYRREELYLERGGRAAPIEGSRLEQRRQVAEMARLATLAEEAVARGAPAPVALTDGVLLLWNYRVGPEDFVRDYFVAEFQAGLWRFAAAEVPVLGYVSRPRAVDVLNLLRALPAHRAACRRCGAGDGRQSCALAGLHDRDLFAGLAPGERSALFEARALAEHYPADLLPHFCYLNVGREVARLEVVAWAAGRPALLARAHAVVVDQCRLGQGYPVALARAHERAVVTSADRRRVNELVARALVAQGLRDRPSEKQAAKLVRAV